MHLNRLLINNWIKIYQRNEFFNSLPPRGGTMSLNRRMAVPLSQMAANLWYSTTDKDYDDTDTEKQKISFS